MICQESILEAPGKLSDKYCRIIKEKFSGFNKEIEEISATQRSYSIPDVELRESLKRDNKEYICPKYNSFYDKYANIPFTKNPEKYVRYTPAEVSSLIDSFSSMLPLRNTNYFVVVLIIFKTFY